VLWPRATTTKWPDLSLDADAIDAPVKLLFPGGRRKAFTVSFDDGLNSDRRLIEILNRHGIRGTFNVPVGAEVGAEGIRTVYAGHEVAVHDGMGEGAPAEFAAQVASAKSNLEAIVGYPVRGMAYVGGGVTPGSAAALADVGIVYGRGIGVSRWFGVDTNFPVWSTTCHQGEAAKYVEAFLAFPGSPALFSLWGHSYEFRTEADWAAIEAVCTRLAGREDIWFATNIELADYVRSAQALRKNAAGDWNNPSAVPVWIEVAGSPRELNPARP